VPERRDFETAPNEGFTPEGIAPESITLRVQTMLTQPLILIVEDNTNDALLVLQTLKQASVPHLVQAVPDGETALAYLSGMGAYSDREKFPLPSLVLLDLKMPGIDGFEVLAWVRQQPQFKDLRVVVLTSSTDGRDLNKAYRLGASSFLLKPFESGNVDALFSILKAQQVWCETPG